MRPALFLSLASTVLFAALAAELPAELAPNTVAVVMDFERPYSARSLTAMQRELESILRPSSLRIQWRVWSDEVSHEVFANVVMARFRGQCLSEAEGQPRHRSKTLGLTHRSGGEIIRFSEVDCDGLREFVATRLGHENRLIGELLYGRAMARVLAHELYHVLAKTTKHGRAGVAKPSFTTGDLLGPELRLDSAQTQDIRSSVAQDRLAVTAQAQTTE